MVPTMSVPAASPSDASAPPADSADADAWAAAPPHGDHTGRHSSEGGR